MLANPGAGRGPHRRSQEDSLPAEPAQPYEQSLGALPLPLGPCGWSRLGSSRARLFFLWPRSGLPGNVFRGRAVVFHHRRSALSAFSRSKRSWLCATQNFQAGGTCCNSAKRELEMIAEPLGLLHEALLSGRSFLAPCAQKLAATLCPCNILLAADQFKKRKPARKPSRKPAKPARKPARSQPAKPLFLIARTQEPQEPARSQPGATKPSQKPAKPSQKPAKKPARLSFQKNSPCRNKGSCGAF